MTKREGFDKNSMELQANMLKQTILYRYGLSGALPFSSLDDLQVHEHELATNLTLNIAFQHFLDNDLYLENLACEKKTRTEVDTHFAIRTVSNVTDLSTLDITTLCSANSTLLLGVEESGKAASFFEIRSKDETHEYPRYAHPFVGSYSYVENQRDNAIFNAGNNVVYLMQDGHPVLFTDVADAGASIGKAIPIPTDLENVTWIAKNAFAGNGVTQQGDPNVLKLLYDCDYFLATRGTSGALYAVGGKTGYAGTGDIAAYRISFGNMPVGLDYEYVGCHTVMDAPAVIIVAKSSDSTYRVFYASPNDFPTVYGASLIREVKAVHLDGVGNSIKDALGGIFKIVEANESVLCIGDKSFLRFTKFPRGYPERSKYFDIENAFSLSGSAAVSQNAKLDPPWVAHPSIEETPVLVLDTRLDDDGSEPQSIAGDEQLIEGRVVFGDDGKVRSDKGGTVVVNTGTVELYRQKDGEEFIKNRLFGKVATPEYSFVDGDPTKLEADEVQYKFSDIWNKFGLTAGNDAKTVLGNGFLSFDDYKDTIKFSGIISRLRNLKNNSVKVTIPVQYTVNANGTESFLTLLATKITPSPSSDEEGQEQLNFDIFKLRTAVSGLTEKKVFDTIKDKLGISPMTSPDAVEGQIRESLSQIFDTSYHTLDTGATSTIKTDIESLGLSNLLTDDYIKSKFQFTPPEIEKIPDADTTSIATSIFNDFSQIVGRTQVDDETIVTKLDDVPVFESLEIPHSVLEDAVVDAFRRTSWGSDNCSENIQQWVTSAELYLKNNSELYLEGHKRSIVFRATQPSSPVAGDAYRTTSDTTGKIILKYYTYCYPSTGTVEKVSDTKKTGYVLKAVTIGAESSKNFFKFSAPSGDSGSADDPLYVQGKEETDGSYSLKFYPLIESRTGGPIYFVALSSNGVTSSDKEVTFQNVPRPSSDDDTPPSPLFTLDDLKTRFTKDFVDKKVLANHQYDEDWFVISTRHWESGKDGEEGHWVDRSGEIKQCKKEDEGAEEDSVKIVDTPKMVIHVSEQQSVEIPPVIFDQNTTALPSNPKDKDTYVVDGVLHYYVDNTDYAIDAHSNDAHSNQERFRFSYTKSSESSDETEDEEKEEEEVSLVVYVEEKPDSASTWSPAFIPVLADLKGELHYCSLEDNEDNTPDAGNMLLHDDSALSFLTNRINDYFNAVRALGIASTYNFTVPSDTPNKTDLDTRFNSTFTNTVQEIPYIDVSTFTVDKSQQKWKDIFNALLKQNYDDDKDKAHFSFGDVTLNFQQAMAPGENAYDIVTIDGITGMMVVEVEQPRLDGEKPFVYTASLNLKGLKYQAKCKLVKNGSVYEYVMEEPASVVPTGDVIDGKVIDGEVTYTTTNPSESAIVAFSENGTPLITENNVKNYISGTTEVNFANQLTVDGVRQFSDSVVTITYAFGAATLPNLYKAVPERYPISNASFREIVNSYQISFANIGKAIEKYANGITNVVSQLLSGENLLENITLTQDKTFTGSITINNGESFLTSADYNSLVGERVSRILSRLLYASSEIDDEAIYTGDNFIAGAKTDSLPVKGIHKAVMTKLLAQINTAGQTSYATFSIVDEQFPSIFNYFTKTSGKTLFGRTGQEIIEIPESSVVSAIRTARFRQNEVVQFEKAVSGISVKVLPGEVYEEKDFTPASTSSGIMVHWLNTLGHGLDEKCDPHPYIDCASFNASAFAYYDRSGAEHAITNLVLMPSSKRVLISVAGSNDIHSFNVSGLTPVDGFVLQLREADEEATYVTRHSGSTTHAIKHLRLNDAPKSEDLKGKFVLMVVFNNVADENKDEVEYFTFASSMSASPFCTMSLSNTFTDANLREAHSQFRGSKVTDVYADSDSASVLTETELVNFVEGYSEPSQNAPNRMLPKFLPTADDIYTHYYLDSNYELNCLSVPQSMEDMYPLSKIKLVKFIPGLIEKVRDDRDFIIYDIDMRAWSTDAKVSYMIVYTSEGVYMVDTGLEPRTLRYEGDEAIKEYYTDRVSTLLEKHLAKKHFDRSLLSRFNSTRRLMSNYDIYDFNLFRNNGRFVGVTETHGVVNDTAKGATHDSRNSVVVHRDIISNGTIVSDAMSNPGVVFAAVSSPLTKLSSTWKKAQFASPIKGTEFYDFFYRIETNGAGATLMTNILNLNHTPFIYRVNSDFTWDLWVDIQSTMTPYLNRIAGSNADVHGGRVKVENKDRSTRKNVEAKPVTSDPTSSATTVRLYIDTKHFSIATIRDVRIAGSSLPMSVYRDSAVNDGLFDGVALKSAWNRQIEVVESDHGEKYAMIEFKVWGTDEQSVHLSGDTRIPGKNE